MDPRLDYGGRKYFKSISFGVIITISIVDKL